MCSPRVSQIWPQLSLQRDVGYGTILDVLRLDDETGRRWPRTRPSQRFIYWSVAMFQCRQISHIRKRQERYRQVQMNVGGVGECVGPSPGGCNAQQKVCARELQSRRAVGQARLGDQAVKVTIFVRRSEVDKVRRHRARGCLGSAEALGRHMFTSHNQQCTGLTLPSFITLYISLPRSQITIRLVSLRGATLQS